jgi:hypothetical protein
MSGLCFYMASSLSLEKVLRLFIYQVSRMLRLYSLDHTVRLTRAQDLVCRRCDLKYAGHIQWIWASEPRTIVTRLIALVYVSQLLQTCYTVNLLFELSPQRSVCSATIEPTRQRLVSATPHPEALQNSRTSVNENGFPGFSKYGRSSIFFR